MIRTLNIAVGFPRVPDRIKQPLRMARRAGKVGISAAELEAFVNPDDYSGEGGTVKQPPYDPAKPHQAYPEAMYQAMIAAPDEITA